MLEEIKKAALKHAVNQINSLGIVYESEAQRQTDIDVSMSDFCAGAEFMQNEYDRLLNILSTTNSFSLKFHKAAVELAELQKNYDNRTSR